MLTACVWREGVYKQPMGIWYRSVATGLGGAIALCLLSAAAATAAPTTDERSGSAADHAEDRDGDRPEAAIAGMSSAQSVTPIAVPPVAIAQLAAAVADTRLRETRDRRDAAVQGAAESVPASAPASAVVASAADRPAPTVPATVSEDVSEDIAEDAAEDIAENVSEDSSEDIVENVAEDIAEDSAEDVAEDVATADATDPGEPVAQAAPEANEDPPVDPFPDVAPINGSGDPKRNEPGDREPADPETPSGFDTGSPADPDRLDFVPPDGSSDPADPAPVQDAIDLRGTSAIDLEPFERNPNPLQFPTLPEEVRILLQQPLTLEQSLEIGRYNSRTLEDARLAVERSRYALRQALAANYPQLRLSASLTDTLTSGTRIGIMESNRQLRKVGRFRDQQEQDESDTLSYSANLELSYNIYTSGQRPATIDAAQHQLRADELAFEALYEDVKFDITDRYYQLQQENAQLEIDKSAVVFRERSVKDAQALEQAGLGTRFEVLQAQVELANDKQQVVQTRDRQTQRRRDLARVLSLPQQIDLQTADDIGKAGDWQLSLEQSIVLAYRNRSELERQLALMDVNDAQRRAVLGQLGPQVSAFGRYEILDVLSPEDVFGPVDGYSVGVQMNWLLYDGGAIRAAAKQEEIDRQREANRFAQIREQIRFDVERSFSNLKANEENIRTSLQAIEAAREEVRLARLRFQAGVGTQTDRLNAETRLTRARGNVLFAVVGYNRALAALNRAVTNLPEGTIVPPAEPLDLPNLADFGPDALNPDSGSGF